MTPRAQEVLFAIVRAYIETGEPQGSRTVSRARYGGVALSAASIRNIMADLAEEGYLSQPHTSAGRIPTENAFREYVGSITTRPLAALDSQRLIAKLSEAQSFESRVARSCQILTDLTSAVGLAATVQLGSGELEQIELIGLADRRVLIVVVTRDGSVSNKVVNLDQTLSNEDLISIRNYINWNFAGWQLEDARNEIQRRLAQERAAYDAILQRLTLLSAKGLLNTERPSHIHLEGASNLVGLDLHLTRERMRELFRALEEKQRVAELLNRFLDGTSNALAVHIGLGEAHPAMKELALIGVSFSLPGGLLTRVAVLGPMRMNYSRVMSAVLEIGRTFERVQAA